MFLLNAIAPALFAITLLFDGSAAACNSALKKCTRYGGTLDESVCKCYCPHGRHGRTCEVKSAGVCGGSGRCSHNRHCVESNSLNGYICACQTGRCGWSCEEYNGQVANQCQCMNGGYCSTAIEANDQGKLYCAVSCKCKIGFGGLKCEIADPCRRNRCSMPNLAECYESSFHPLGRTCVVFNQHGSMVHLDNNDQ